MRKLTFFAESILFFGPCNSSSTGSSSDAAHQQSAENPDGSDKWSGTDNPSKAVHLSYRNLLVFLLPSLVGIGMFLIPIKIDEAFNVGMGFLAYALMGLLENSLPTIAVMAHLFFF